MIPASADEVAELLGDRADESIVDRIVNLGASLEQVREALEDYDFQLQFGAAHTPTSLRVEEVRTILEELPAPDDVLAEPVDEDDEYEGLTLVDASELDSGR